MEVMVPNLVELTDVGFSMTSLPSCSDSYGCDDNSGDDSVTRVGELGNCHGSCHSLFWINNAICKVHNDDTALHKVSE
jgi:hypothetical protein